MVLVDVPSVTVLIIRFRDEISLAHRIHIVDRVDQDSDCFCLVIVDFFRKKIFYLDPRVDVLEYHQRARDVGELLNRFLDHNMEEGVHGDEAHAWTIAMSVDSGMHFPILQNDFDSGMYVFMFTYFAVFESPIFFDNDDIIRMRKQLAYWILKEYLPM